MGRIWQWTASPPDHGPELHPGDVVPAASGAYVAVSRRALRQPWHGPKRCAQGALFHLPDGKGCRGSNGRGGPFNRPHRWSIDGWDDRPGIGAPVPTPCAKSLAWLHESQRTFRALARAEPPSAWVSVERKKPHGTRERIHPSSLCGLHAPGEDQRGFPSSLPVQLDLCRFPKPVRGHPHVDFLPAPSSLACPDSSGPWRSRQACASSKLESGCLQKSRR